MVLKLLLWQTFCNEQSGHFVAQNKPAKCVCSIPILLLRYSHESRSRSTGLNRNLNLQEADEKEMPLLTRK